MVVPQKPQEFKLRAIPSTRSDQKEVSRVFLSADVMYEMGLKAGQPCYLWKSDEPDSKRREALVFNVLGQKLNKDVIQIYKPFQEICGFKLEDRITILPAEELKTAETVSLRDVTPGAALSERDRVHWEWALEEKLRRAEFLFTGMKFELAPERPKRTFVVISSFVGGRRSTRQLVRFGESSLGSIVDESSAETVEDDNAPRPRLILSGISGIDSALARLNESLDSFSLEREQKWSWAARPSGILIHGSAGTGKSHILNLISETGWGDIFHVSWDVKPSGLREVFTEARKCRRSLIIIDDIERIVSKEHGGTQNLDLILAEQMDRLIVGDTTSNVLVVAATTTISDIPSALRCYPRFTEEVLLPIPNAESRRKILRSLVPTSSPETFFTLLDGVGDRTHAYTPRDLLVLSHKAAEKAMARIRKSKTQNIDIVDDWITQDDFEEALVIVRPSAMHDITLQPPKVRWEEIGGQDSVKKALRRAVETPLLYPDILAQHARTPKKGILLYGPPGCSKTLSAQAMATQIGFNFFAVKGAELLNMYVGESERAVREVFARARAASPSIIFFDEIESIGSKREKRGNNGVNVLTTLLNEMDGIEALKGVFVLAATNKPEALDEALLRPGRFDDLLYVSPPDLTGRGEILRNRGKISSWDEELITAIPELAVALEGYSGAEVVGICQKASDAVIERSIDSGVRDLKVLRADFEEAMKATRKQITREMVKGYEDWAAGRRG